MASCSYIGDGGVERTSSKRRVHDEAEEHRWGTVSKPFFNVAIGTSFAGRRNAAGARDRSPVCPGIRKKLQDAYPDGPGG